MERERERERAREEREDGEDPSVREQTADESERQRE